jgi:hypothetical protein
MVPSSTGYLAVFGQQRFEVDGVGIAGRRPVVARGARATHPRDVAGWPLTRAVVSDRWRTTPRRTRGAV